MSSKRILIISTPVGALGSGVGGGVELTLHSLVLGLTGRGHHVEVLAPEHSLHVGTVLHQIPGTLQPSAHTAAATRRSRSSPTACWRRCATGHGAIRTTSM